MNTVSDNSRDAGSDSESEATPGCRFCGQPIERMFLDLGMSPPCQNRIFPDQLNHTELFYPLRVLLCENCFLVQLQEYVAPGEIFSDYAYFSSYSASWVKHAERYVEFVIDRFSLGEESRVVELASNDGYLLQHFVTRKVTCLGIEPADNVAEVARKKGIPTISKFFGADVASEVREEYGSADLIVGNNVLAHVPDLNGFVSGLKLLLGDLGVVTMEFPHLERLIAENQFDTIYHEHFSYLSFSVVEKVFAQHGLRLFDVQELPTHGGSLRIFACHEDCSVHESTSSVTELRSREASNGFSEMTIYDEFAVNVKATKRNNLAYRYFACAGSDRQCTATCLLEYRNNLAAYSPFPARRNRPPAFPGRSDR